MLRLRDMLLGLIRYDRAFVTSYVLLAIGVFINDGAFAPSAFALLCMSFAYAVYGIVQMKRLHEATALTPGFLLGCIALLIVVAMTKWPVSYINWLPYVQIFGGANILLLIVILAVYATELREDSSLRRIVFTIALGTMVFLRLLVPIVSPHPIIDVHSATQQSAKHLLKGMNPYQAYVKDVYESRYQYKNKVIHYMYPPANLYFQTPFFAAFGDVRFGLIFFEGIAALCIFLLARRKFGLLLAELLTLLFLVHPRGLFLIEQSWTEPLLLACFATSLLAQTLRKHRLSTMILGIFFSLKQYTPFTFIPWIFCTRPTLKHVLLVLLTIFCTFLPFFLWDFRSVFEQGILFQQHTAFRYDSLSLSSLLYPYIGVISKSITLIVGISASLLTSWWLRHSGLQGFVFASMLTLFSLFLFGTQAFCNYYYLVSGLLLLSLTLPSSSPSLHDEDSHP